MAPTPEQTMASEAPRPLRRSGEEVVISGISGIFPSSDSVQEFSENLYNKVDMVTSDNPRWVFNHPETPKHVGKVNGMGKFDAQFFRVHYKQACTMEPMSRKLLEHAYSAIYDSGMNPLQLRGKKVGVFIGSTFSESEKIVIYENVQRNGFGITGCNKAMYANRISYWLDGKGPSYSLDLACASSSACVEHAYRSISSGLCDAAIVGGCNLCMHPNVSLHCRRAGFLCLDGKTKCFDKNGDGYVRSDAVCVLFLQKAKDAKRIYSEVYHAKAAYSPTSEQLLPIRAPQDLQQFFEAFYSEIGVLPEDVDYIEANGAAIPVADSNEITAIGKVFGKGKPIKVGCVKSNMGSSEPASGVCAIVKMCLAYHSGKLPGNLHYSDPLDNPEIHDNKLQVLTDNTNFSRRFAAVNTFSYSGANVHVLLKGHYKHKDTESYKSSIPHLVLISGRQENCATNILEKLKKKPIDPEEIGLLHNIHRFDVPGHMSRGYSILDTNDKKETVSLSQSTEYYPGNTRPVWFVYSGMGSQWNTMGAQLMRIPIFAAAIEKCNKVLEPKGIDIVRILTDPDKTIYDNILNSFVGIAAVQIGLTDILRDLGIVPDNIIGHSVGELGCAYADGCFTREEMILSAYSRGLVSLQTDFIRGSMAAVGMGYKDILPLCPPEIEVACHNSSESATISGPADIMKQFVTELTEKGVFAKEVPCSNIAYHSRYIAEAGPGLLKYLKEVIKNPKARSDKWVSTSVPQNEWDQDKAKYSSAEYHTNNLLNSVLFEETSQLIPSDALVIEIAPHGLLQAILKRSLSDCVHVPLTRRGNPDPVKFLLEAIGKLFQAGLHPKVDVLYPKIEYPVSTGTPFLSQYVEWEHSEDWPQARYNTKDRKVATVRDFVMSIHDDDFKYFKGHVRNGNYIFPESAFLVLVWETLAMYKGVNFKDMSVLLQNVQFHGEAIIKPELPLKLQIMIMKGNNKFEVCYEDSAIVTGFVFETKSSERSHQDLKKNRDDSADSIKLNAQDIYSIMRLKGYNYKDEFRSIHSASSNFIKANIKWTGDWITYLDSLIQFNVLARDYDGISSPSLIKKLRIDVKGHINAEKITGVTCFMAELYNTYEYTRSGGVEIDGLVFKDEPITNYEKYSNVLFTQSFVPSFLTGIMPIKGACQVHLQIVSENITEGIVHVIDCISKKMPEISKAISDVTSEIITHDFSICDDEEKVWNPKSLEKANLVVIDNLLADAKKMNKLYNGLSKDAFVLALEHDNTKINPQYKLFDIVSAMSIQKKMLILLRKVDRNVDKNLTYMKIVQNQNFTWIHRLEAELKKSKTVVLVSERQPLCGLLGMVRKLRAEYGNKIRLVVVDDYHVSSFNPEEEIFKDQLKKNLAFNILNKGQWGGYYNISNTKALPVNNLRLSCAVPGDLDSLMWEEKPLTTPSTTHIQVSYSGPSYKEAQNAVRFDTQALGMDYSGTNSRGDKVMGIISGGTIASSVEDDTEFLWPVPSHWSLEDAATVPLPYVHAYYCLAIKYELTNGQTILVNGGTSALSQAVIAIATSMDCLVYVAVEDLRQKEFLLKMFPTLEDINVSCCYDSLLHNMMNSDKNKNYMKRCDVVINCASGSERKAAMKCIGWSGVFLDVNEYDMRNNDDFGMHFLFRISTYIGVRFDSIFHKQNSQEKKMLQVLVAEGIANGIVRPLTRVVYSPVDVTAAFRMMSSNRLRGRVLIKMKSPESLVGELNITERMQYSPKGSYIIISDGTILSIELADRLVKHGVRNLVLHISNNLITGYCYTKIKSWNKQNVSVKISSENLQSEKGCSNLIREGAKSGSLRGVFIVNECDSGATSCSPDDVRNKYNNTANIVANLDSACRNICNELEHFVVINHGNQSVSDAYIASVIDRICRARNDIGLPALVFRTGLVAELNDSEDINPKTQPQPLTAIFNALETSLKQNYKNVVTYIMPKRNTSDFLFKVSRIIGIKNISEIDADITLKDLHLNPVVIEEINALIKQTYQVAYPVEKLEGLAINKLLNLERELTNEKIRKDIGLGAFFTYIDSDECSAAEPIVTMGTLYSGFEEEEELDPKATYLMLVPGFEGHHQIFNTVAERLKVQALALQLVPDLANDSVPQIAANIAKYIKNRLVLKSKFYLLGYSFGVNVALELARIFEKEGHVGVVYCLDSSPDALRAQLDAYLGHLSDSLLQDSIIAHMYTLMTGHDSALLSQLLPHQHDWRDKVELCVNELRGLAKYSHQYKRCILNSAYKRIMLAREYEPNFTLQSELILIKGVLHPNMDVSNLAEDFNLSKYTNKPVQVFNIESDHASAYRDCRVSNIVNTLLEPKLLDEFKNKNLCWTYLADPIKTW